MHHMKVFQLIMKDETNEKRNVMISWTAKDDFPSWIPTRGRARRSLKHTPLLGYHEWQGQKVFETYSPSWIPRMAGPEGLWNSTNLPAYPLLGCHEWQGQKGIQIILLLNQVQVVSDPIGSLICWSWDQSHCFNQIGPQTQWSERLG